MTLSKITFAFGLLGLMTLASCGGTQSASATQDSTLQQVDSATLATDIPFEVADRYFAASDSLPNTITSEAELHYHLGMAATMDAQPTPIDFEKSFVIPVCLAPTSVSTEIRPVSLRKNAEGGLTFTYQVIQGADMKTSQMIPFLAVIVPREYLAPVRLEEAK